MKIPMLSSNSYTIQSGYIPDDFLELDKKFVFQTEHGIIVRESQLTELIDNMTTKLGFVLLSRDYLASIPQTNQITINYFLNNFVYDAKAYLDSVSVILNFLYELNFKGGDIDLKWKRFQRTVSQKSDFIQSFLTSEKEWIKEIIEWREQLIHRISAPIIFFGTGEDMAKNNLHTKMPIIPITISELQKRAEELRQKYGSVEQEILPFCDNWITKSKKLFEAVCKSILRDYTPRKQPKSNT